MLVLSWSSIASSIVVTKTASAAFNPSMSIIGGVLVKPRDPIASSTVALISLQDKGMSLCSGSIIDTDLILTAAHCVGPNPARMLVIFGHDLSEKAEKVARVTAYLRHPDFGVGHSAEHDEDLNDIALIRFEGGIPAGFATAQLLTEHFGIEDGESITLAGFGRNVGDVSKHKGDDGTGVLRQVQTTIRTARHGKSEILTEQSYGRGACHGDSGGPAFIRGIDGKQKLFGITSRGPAQAVDDCASYGIYTDISAHRGFLADAAIEMREYGWSD